MASFDNILKALRGGNERSETLAGLEAAATFGTGALGYGLGAVGGLVDMARGKGFAQAQRTAGDVSDALTYQPRSPEGQEMLAGVGRLLAPVQVVPDAARDWTNRATGVPMLGAVAGVVGDPLNWIPGAKGLKAGEKAAAKGAEKAAVKAAEGAARHVRLPGGARIPGLGSAERAAFEKAYLKEMRDRFLAKGEEFKRTTIPLDSIEGGHGAPLDVNKTRAYSRGYQQGAPPNPPVVYPTGEGRYTTLDGTRRLEAARAAGLKELDVLEAPPPKVDARAGLPETDPFGTGSTPEEAADFAKYATKGKAKAKAKAKAPAAAVDESSPDALFQGYQGGGFTLDPRTGRQLSIGKDTGYSVAAYPGLSRTVKAGEATPEAIRQYLADVQGTLASDPDAFVGGWKSPEGNLVLDVPRVLQDEAQARALGTQHGERAIFDLSKGDNVNLDELGAYEGHKTPEQAASWRPGEPKPAAKNLSSRFRGMRSLVDAEQAAEGGMHLERNTDKGAQSGSFVSMDPAIRGEKQLEGVRQRRLEQTERGAPYAGWYIDEGGLPADPKTGFEGGALWKTNPDHPSTDTYAAHSPQASPGVNLVREVAVEHGVRQPEWPVPKVLETVEADRARKAAERARAKALSEQTGKKVKPRVTGSSLPKSVKPMYSEQVGKHLGLRTGALGPEDMGPKEGAFAGNLMDEDHLSTIDRHEIRTLDKEPVNVLEDNIAERTVGDEIHGLAQGENLVLNARMRALAAMDPTYLERIGWPRYPDGSLYPLDPRGGQAARWLEQKSTTDFPKLHGEDPQAARDAVLADPMNRVTTTAPLIAATERIEPGFDWRTPTGHDPLYLQEGIRQWPETTPSSPERAHPLAVPGTEGGTVASSPRTMETAGLTPASERFIRNRASTRLLAQGSSPETSVSFHGNEYPVELPLSQEGAGTGAAALLERLSPAEKAELGPRYFEALDRFPAPKSPAAAKTRGILREGGVPGLEEWVKKYGTGGLLSLPFVLPYLTDTSEQSP